MRTKIHYNIFVLSLALISCNTNRQNKPASLFWYQKQLRILQTVLREPDAIGYDARSVVRYMQASEYNTLVVNAGGIIDFYPDSMEMSRANRFLAGRDLLEEITAACKKENIRVIARIDFRGVEEERYKKHPHWFAINSDGSPKIYTYTTPVFYAPCYHGYYRNEYAINIIKKILTRYPVDGIWYNSVHCHDNCWCPACKKAFREWSGFEMPQSKNTDNRMLFEDFRKYSAEHYLQTIYKTVKEFGPEKAFVAEIFGMYKSEMMKRTGMGITMASKYMDFLPNVCFITHSHQSIEYNNANYSASIIRYLRSVNPFKQPVILFGSNQSTHRYVAEESQYLRAWVFESIASGGSVWNCLFNGAHPGLMHDRRNACLLKDIIRFMKKNANCFENALPVFNTAIYFSENSSNICGDDKPETDYYFTEVQGWENVLNASHIFYGFINAKGINTETLKSIHTLILPNTVYLSEKEILLITEFVQQGGTLIASGATSLYNNLGQKLDNFALSGLLGVRFNKKVHYGASNFYQKIRIKNNLIENIKDTELLFNLDSVYECKPDAGTIVITTMVPQFNSQPPELAWIEDMETDIPVMSIHKAGKGQVIYFSNLPGRIFYFTQNSDIRCLMVNSVNNKYSGVQITHSNIPATVHTHLIYDSLQKKYILSLVNNTGIAQSSSDKAISINDIQFTLQLPEGIKYHNNLFGDAEVRCMIKHVKLKIRRIDEFYSVALHN